MADLRLREQVRDRYAAAALAVTAGRTNSDALAAEGCCGSTTAESDGCCSTGSCEPASAQVDESFGPGLYGADEQGELPPEALAASLGCGNPLAVAELRPGERVLDLGSGGGIDVLLSARRVGETGIAYGVDMTDEMLALARANAAKAGTTNVKFLKGTIEDVPLPDGAVDVVISNCVINLSVDKPAVLTEMYRVLAPGGRIGVSDVVAEDDVTQPTGPLVAATWVVSPVPCRARNISMGYSQQASFTPRSASLTKQRQACMRPSSAPSSPVFRRIGRDLRPVALGRRQVEA
jgi:SAM-dependent methyltransferase